ncbi:hypothetical protein [Streptomyces ardesiacus]|uniref:hypothetical protein n=1 Tax=Streptomyces ardesiacus TaxID=285564 RepID=UPI00364E6F85
MNRDERIEEYYHHGTRELAEWVVDLEDEVAALVSVDKDRIEKLVELSERADFLCALESLGVDNWDGYNAACDAYNRGDF